MMLNNDSVLICNKKIYKYKVLKSQIKTEESLSRKDKNSGKKLLYITLKIIQIS